MSDRVTTILAYAPAIRRKPSARAIESHASTGALPSRRRALALAALATGLAIAWLPIHLTLPLGRDQAMIWIWGSIATGVYAADVFFIAVAAGAMWMIGRSLSQAWIAPIGTIALVLVVRDAQTYGQPDLWLAAIWLWVLAAFMHPAWGERLASYVIAGAVSGIAIMVKPVFVLLLVLPLLLAAQARDPRRAAASLVPFAAASGGVLAIFAAGDRLDDLVEVYFGFNALVHAGPGGDTIAVALARFLVTAVAPWFDAGAAAITITACLGARVMARRDPARMRMLAVTWAIGLGCILLQGRSHQHHFALANAAVAVFVAYAISPACARARPTSSSSRISTICARSGG